MLRSPLLFFLLLAFASVRVDTDVLENEAYEGPSRHLIKEELANILHELLSPSQCPAPFEPFRGLCLLFNSNSSTWWDAEQFCSSRGGHLTSIADRLEHNTVRRFVQGKQHYAHFWIGLHRGPNSSLAWSSGKESSSQRIYSGPYFTEKDNAVFAVDSRDFEIRGRSNGTKLSSVCRLIQPLNLKKMVGKALMQIEYTVNECPSPWVRQENMCLLYMFTLRTWPAAEELCLLQGGALAWIESKEEHNAIRNLYFASHKRWRYNYWIGLHKDEDGQLEWAGYSNSPYRGSPLTNPNKKYFYAKMESTEIIGADENKKSSVLCRRPL